MLPFAMSIDVRKHTDAFESLVVFIFVVVFDRVALGVRNYSSTKKTIQFKIHEGENLSDIEIYSICFTERRRYICPNSTGE